MSRVVAIVILLVAGVLILSTLLKYCCCCCQSYIGFSSSREPLRNSPQSSIPLTHVVRECQQVEQAQSNPVALARQRDLDGTGTTSNALGLPPRAIIHQSGTALRRGPLEPPQYSPTPTSYDMGPVLEEGEDEALRMIRVMGGAAPTYEEATTLNNVLVTAQV